MDLRIFVYFDTSANDVQVTLYDFWAHGTDPENPTLKDIGHSLFYLLGEINTTLDTNFDPLVARLEGLEWALKKERLESAKKQANLQEQIDNLKAIGYEAVNTPSPHITGTDFPDDFQF